jgi:hypothetical protein
MTEGWHMTKGMTYDSRSNRTIEGRVIAEERLMTKESTLWQKGWSYGKRDGPMAKGVILWQKKQYLCFSSVIGKIIKQQQISHKTKLIP